MEIKINCQGAGVENLDDLIIIQGNLKELSDTNFAKLHDLIITNGFDSPIQVWIDPESKRKILDGTQRKKVLIKLREEGYSIPSIPVDYIQADSYENAKRRLLTKVSVYGEVNEKGLDEFINEPDAIIEPDFGELLDIPGIDFDKADEEKPKREPKEIECPACNHRFFPK